MTIAQAKRILKPIENDEEALNEILEYIKQRREAHAR